MKKIYYLFIFVFSFSVLSAQEKLSKEEKARREKNIQAGNPFAQFGYKAKIATLSKGKYLEFHDLDSIVTIGTVRWHVLKNEIVGRIVQDSLNPDAQPIGDRVGRWISPDPLSEEFPSWSPYNMCLDNPLKYKDPDGRAPVDWFKSASGRVVWFDNTSKGFTDTNGGKWTNVGSNLNEVKQSLNVPTGVQNISWSNTKVALSDGTDGAGKQGAAVNVINFKSTAQVDYSLNVKNEGPAGQLLSGKTEISGVNINARVTTETFAPGTQIDGVSGAFGVKEFTPSSLMAMGNNFTGKSSPFQNFSGQMLSNAPFHATSEATLKLNLPTFNTLNNSFGTPSGLNLKFNTSTSTTNLGTGDDQIFKTGN